MKAFVREEYGPPEVLELRDLEKPIPGDEELLVRVRAASVNPFDWHMLTGAPYIVRPQSGLRRPKDGRLGVDYAGTVEAVGAQVTQFTPGDEVFGGRDGAFGEYVTPREAGAVARKPADVTFEQAAAVGIAGLTALQGLRDRGRLQPGQNVLVNGASGGVGTWAVQLGKWLGAEVTGVCSTRNVEAARRLGADRVIDYAQEDFTRSAGEHDLMLDIAGDRSWGECKRVLKDDGTLVLVGGPKMNRWLGPLGHAVGLRLASRRGGRETKLFVAKLNGDDMRLFAELLAAGTVTPAIERQYELEDVPEALAYVGDGHARAKVVVSVPGMG
jgi:NADPH:quinone reductase-like Zn-dependent oxidoreductase